MGFSVSGATVVVLVGLMVSVGTLYPVLEDDRERYTGAQDAHEGRALDRQNTALAVQNVTYTNASELPGSEDRLDVTVRNTGTTTLSVDETDLLVDGVYTVPNVTSVEGDATRNTWAGGQSLTLTVRYPSTTAAPNRVVVVTEHGVADAETQVS